MRQSDRLVGESVGQSGNYEYIHRRTSCPCIGCCECNCHNPPVPEPEKLEVCIRHPTLWFPDGSVVLRIERTLYRLSRSYLQRHAEYFAQKLEDIIGVATEKVEGCPVVDVPVVTAVDFTYWLSAVESGL